MKFKPLSATARLSENWLILDRYAFLVARTSKSNKAYVRAVAEESEHLTKGAKIDPNDALDIERRAFVKTCLNGWGVVDDNGTIIPGALPDDNGELTFEFNARNAQLLAENYVDIIDDLVDMAGNVANYKEKRELEIAKK